MNGMKFHGIMRGWCAREIREHPSGVLAREQGLAPERARVLPAATTMLAAVLEHFGE